MKAISLLTLAWLGKGAAVSAYNNSLFEQATCSLLTRCAEILPNDKSIYEAALQGDFAQLSCQLEQDPSEQAIRNFFSWVGGRSNAEELLPLLDLPRMQGELGRRAAENALLRAVYIGRAGAVSHLLRKELSSVCLQEALRVAIFFQDLRLVQTISKDSRFTPRQIYRAIEQAHDRWVDLCWLRSDFREEDSAERNAQLSVARSIALSLAQIPALAHPDAPSFLIRAAIQGKEGMVELLSTNPLLKNQVQQALEQPSPDGKLSYVRRLSAYAIEKLRLSMGLPSLPREVWEADLFFWNERLRKTALHLELAGTESYEVLSKVYDLFSHTCLPRGQPYKALFSHTMVLSMLSPFAKKERPFLQAVREGRDVLVRGLLVNQATLPLSWLYRAHQENLRQGAVPPFLTENVLQILRAKIYFLVPKRPWSEALQPMAPLQAIQKPFHLSAEDRKTLHKKFVVLERTRDNSNCTLRNYPGERLRYGHLHLMNTSQGDMELLTTFVPLEELFSQDDPCTSGQEGIPLSLKIANEQERKDMLQKLQNRQVVPFPPQLTGTWIRILKHSLVL